MTHVIDIALENIVIGFIQYMGFFFLKQLNPFGGRVQVYTQDLGLTQMEWTEKQKLKTGNIMIKTTKLQVKIRF